MNITTITNGMQVVNKLDTLSLAIEGIKEIGKIIFTMAKVLGVIKPEINMQELGDKALQAATEGITPEKYETYSAYVEALNDYILDPERTQKISEELKEMKGVELAICLLAEKFVETPIVNFIEAIIDNPKYFDDKKIEIISELINENKSFISDFLNYVSGREKDENKLNDICNKLVEVEKKVHPEISDKEAYKLVMEISR